MAEKIVILSEEAYEQLNSKLDAILEKTRTEKNGEPVWLTNLQVMKLMNISRSSLQTYRDKMVIPFYQIGRKILYKAADIDAYLESKYKIQSPSKTK